MKLLLTETSTNKTCVVLDDMILTKDMPTTAGSKMLDGYRSPFDAEVVTKLAQAGYALGGKTNVGEFAVDLLGETSYFGACTQDGALIGAADALVQENEAIAALQLDVNGAPRRSAALSGNICVKPTYGTVSRYGTIPVACSGETVCVTAQTVSVCRDILSAVAGHDDKDGTSLPRQSCDLLKKDAPRKAVKKVAILTELASAADRSKLADFRAFLEGQGIACTEVSAPEIAAANTAWNILMTAELCNNVSRYDGVKFGYRSATYTNIDELYTNSRTEAFGDFLKTMILYGSRVLSSGNYEKMYDKALRVRRVIAESFAKLFEAYDCVLIPACGKERYTPEDVQADKYLACKENLFTAPASISGLPAVIVGGVQLMGPAFSENSLLDLAESYEKEHKK